MLRTLCVVLGLLAMTLSNAGCRSCSSCHDYDPPVANCDCGGGGCSSCESCGDSNSGCCGGGCGCCTTRTGSANGAYSAPVPGEYPEGYVEGEGQVVEPAPADPDQR